MVLFEPVDGERFRSQLVAYPGLVEAVVRSLGPDVHHHRFGATFTDPDAEAFWQLTAQAEQDQQLACDLDLARLALASDELTRDELEAVARVCNAARIAMPDGLQDTLAWQLLTTVCSEATDALLG